jgi:hypothetical protein
MSQIKIKAPSANGSNKLFYCKFESVISLLRSTLFSYKILKRLGPELISLTIPVPPPTDV